MSNPKDHNAVWLTYFNVLLNCLTFHLVSGLNKIKNLPRNGQIIYFRHKRCPLMMKNAQIDNDFMTLTLSRAEYKARASIHPTGAQW